MPFRLYPTVTHGGAEPPFTRLLPLGDVVVVVVLVALVVVVVAAAVVVVVVVVMVEIVGAAAQAEAVFEVAVLG